MKNAGRIAVVFLVVLMIICLCACGQDVEEMTYTEISSSQTENSQNVSEKKQESSSEAVKEASSDVSSEVSSEKIPQNIDGALPECDPVDTSYFDDAVFVGDSVSLKLEYYESAMDELGEAQFLTAGSLGSGNALWEVSDESVHPEYNGEKLLLKDSIPLTGANKLYIMLGMNDLGVYEVDQAVDNMETLINSILTSCPDLKIYIQSMTPLTATSEILGDSLNNDNVRIYNGKLMELCNKNGWYFVDVASVMYDDAGNLIRDYCSDPDNMGVHFTEEGYEKWINYLYTHAAE